MPLIANRYRGCGTLLYIRYLLVLYAETLATRALRHSARCVNFEVILSFISHRVHRLAHIFHIFYSYRDTLDAVHVIARLTVQSGRCRKYAAENVRGVCIRIYTNYWRIWVYHTPTFTIVPTYMRPTCMGDTVLVEIYIHWMMFLGLSLRVFCFISGALYIYKA